MRKIILIALGTALFALETSVSASAASDGPPAVVELFTSQGCSSCPPADRLLAELAERDDVIAVAYHVNYWDYIGWKDPFATQWSTERQYSYARVLGRGYPYTPQMVVDGKRDVVGSRRGAVANALVDSMKEADDRINLSIRRDGSELTVTLPNVELKEPLYLWLLRYSGPHETKVLRGENRGETLVDTHIARHLELLGPWHGEAEAIRTAMPLPEEREGGVAVWVQRKGPGAILGAAKLDIDPES